MHEGSTGLVDQLDRTNLLEKQYDISVRQYCHPCPVCTGRPPLEEQRCCLGEDLPMRMPVYPPEYRQPRFKPNVQNKTKKWIVLKR